MASSDAESMDEQEKLEELQPIDPSPQRQNVNEDKKRKRVGMLVIINKYRTDKNFNYHQMKV